MEVLDKGNICFKNFVQKHNLGKNNNCTVSTFKKLFM